MPVLTFYQRSVNWIDRKFKALYSDTNWTLEQIFACIEDNRPAEVRTTLAPGKAWSRAIMNYKNTANRAYPERKAKK